MDRRTVLAALASLASGCLGLDESDTETAAPALEQTGTERTETERATRTPTETPTDAQTTATSSDPYTLVSTSSEPLSPDAVRQRVSDRDCASVVDEQPVCPGDDGQVVVERSSQVISLPEDALEFTLTNTADEPFNWNPYGWRIHFSFRDEWRRVMPVARPLPADDIEPSESYTYSLSVDNATFFEENYHETRDLRFAGLDPGVYAFSISGYLGRDPEASRTYTALFGAAGEPPAIEPTDDVERVARDGSTLHVYEGDHSEIPTLRARVTDSDPDYAFSTVEVRQSRDLRNTLSYLATEGVTEISYHGSDSPSLVTDAILSAAGNPGTYGFAGYSFELR